MLRMQRFTQRMTNPSPAGLAGGSQRLHYAWVIVTVASLICMITSPVRFAISMLIPYLQSPQGFGWSYFAISIAFALQWLATAFISPLVGWSRGSLRGPPHPPPGGRLVHRWAWYSPAA